MPGESDEIPPYEDYVDPTSRWQDERDLINGGPEDNQNYKREPLGFLNEEDRYPTEWQVRDGFAREEWRQLDKDTYQIKNPEVVWTLPKRGWDKYNESPFEFLKWADAHNFKVVLTEDFDG